MKDEFLLLVEQYELKSVADTSRHPRLERCLQVSVGRQAAKRE